MIRILLAATIGLFAVTSSFASDDLTTARGVIEKQLVAFLKDDVDEAFSYSTPAVKKAFREPQHFFNMVKHNFPPVYRPGNYAFGRALSETDGATIAQELLITGPNGKSWKAVFVLLRQDDGEYRINTVRLTKLKGYSL